VLAPGNGKTKTGRLSVYVRDDRASTDMTPPTVWFACTPDRKGIHLQQHLKSFSGTLQADAYGGYQAIYETEHMAEARAGHLQDDSSTSCTRHDSMH
jgi:transposase